MAYKVLPTDSLWIFFRLNSEYPGNTSLVSRGERKNDIIFPPSFSRRDFSSIAKPLAKGLANSENEYETENEVVNVNKKPVRLSKMLFADCEFYDQQKFIAAFSGTGYEHYNLPYYYECVKTWSAQGNRDPWASSRR